LRHQSDSLYKVVDALNRHVTLLSTIYTYVLGFDTFYKTYPGDASFGQIYTELMEGGKQDNYVLLNAYLFHGLRLCVPVFFLQEHIIHELHCKGHFGQDKTWL